MSARRLLTLPGPGVEELLIDLLRRVKVTVLEVEMNSLVTNAPSTLNLKLAVLEDIDPRLPPEGLSLALVESITGNQESRFACSVQTLFVALAQALKQLEESDEGVVTVEEGAPLSKSAELVSIERFQQQGKHFITFMLKEP